MPQPLERGQADRWLVGAGPSRRTASSTDTATASIEESVTGRFFEAARMPATTLDRWNGSVSPDRLTTSSATSSTRS
jgi:hypothetical protein